MTSPTRRWPATLHLATAALLAVLAVGGIVAPTAAQQSLTVYTAVEADDLKKYAARFNEDHPNIQIKWVRDSTTSSARGGRGRRTVDLISSSLAATAMKSARSYGSIASSERTWAR